MNRPSRSKSTPTALQNQDPYIEHVHAKCGGRVVLVARSNTDWRIACSKCSTAWGFNSIWPLELRLDADFEVATELREVNHARS